MADLRIDLPKAFIRTLKQDMEKLGAIAEVASFLRMVSIHNSIQDGEMVSDQDTDTFIKIITGRSVDLMVSPIFRYMAISYLLSYPNAEGNDVDLEKNCTCNCDNA